MIQNTSRASDNAIKSYLFLPVRQAAQGIKKRLFSVRSETPFVLLRSIGLVILLGIPLFLFYAQPAPSAKAPHGIPPWLEIEWPGGRYVWTLIIALLPLAIVLMGFYNWRKICPLAFFGRLSEWIGWPDRSDMRDNQRRRKRVSPWLAKNYPVITWGFLTAMLVLRILLINSNAVALALTFIGLCLSAALVSFLYTGKTWCNFICPVGTIEKIYLVDNPSHQSVNSKCVKCTGCKLLPSRGLCPDIHFGRDYREELLFPARAAAFYAWPGTVLGFYFWYVLHRPTYWHDLQQHGVNVLRGRAVEFQPAGTTYDWGYYYSGDWTRDPAPWHDWFSQGFGFAHLPVFLAKIPTVLAAPLTLLAFSGLSYGLFRLIEWFWRQVNLRRGLRRKSDMTLIRDRMFAFAAFLAFNLFYLFAGAPTLRMLPMGLYNVFHLGVFALSLWLLFRRMRPANPTLIELKPV